MAKKQTTKTEPQATKDSLATGDFTHHGHVIRRSTAGTFYTVSLPGKVFKDVRAAERAIDALRALSAAGRKKAPAAAPANPDLTGPLAASLKAARASRKGKPRVALTGAKLGFAQADAPELKVTEDAEDAPAEVATAPGVNAITRDLLLVQAGESQGDPAKLEPLLHMARNLGDGPLIREMQAAAEASALTAAAARRPRRAAKSPAPAVNTEAPSVNTEAPAVNKRRKKVAPAVKIITAETARVEAASVVVARDATPEQVVAALEPALADAAKKAWATHPNNPAAAGEAAAPKAKAAPNRKVGKTSSGQPIWAAESGFKRVHQALERGATDDHVVQLMARALPRYVSKDHLEAAAAHASTPWLVRAHLLAATATVAAKAGAK